MTETITRRPKAAVGRIVHLLIHPGFNNGSDVCAAVVTRVWHDDPLTDHALVNLRALRDATPDSLELRQSVPLYDNEADARAEFERRKTTPSGMDDLGAGFLAFWPQRF